jgi:hypothetical protein
MLVGEHLPTHPASPTLPCSPTNGLAGEADRAGPRRYQPAVRARRRRRGAAERAAVGAAAVCDQPSVGGFRLALTFHFLL